MSNASGRPMRSDDQAAASAATTVARQLGVPGEVRLLRSGMNHVFVAGELVVRVTPGSVDVASQLALLEWLSAQGLPVLLPVSDVIPVDRFQVTAWEYLPTRRPPDYRQLGAAIAWLHELSAAEITSYVRLPWCGDAAWLHLGETLEAASDAGVVADEDIAVLHEEAAGLAYWQDAARQEDAGVCHGDVHPKNVLMRGDEIVILDWDSICLGPPAWDHAALLTWAERWGGNAADYPDFAEGYGADLRGSPLAQLLARVRLLAPTLNMIIKGRESPHHAEEARRRMRYWRGDPSAPAWTPQ